MPWADLLKLSKKPLGLKLFALEDDAWVEIFTRSGDGIDYSHPRATATVFDEDLLRFRSSKHKRINPLAFYDPSFIDVDCELWLNPAKLLPLVEILVDCLGREAVKSFGFLFPANFGVNSIVVSLFEAIHPVLP